MTTTGISGRHTYITMGDIDPLLEEITKIKNKVAPLPRLGSFTIRFDMSSQVAVSIVKKVGLGLNVAEPVISNTAPTFRCAYTKIDENNVLNDSNFVLRSRVSDATGLGTDPFGLVTAPQCWVEPTHGPDYNGRTWIEFLGFTMKFGSTSYPEPWYVFLDAGEPGRMEWQVDIIDYNY